jgi:hypothetical protein
MIYGKKIENFDTAYPVIIPDLAEHYGVVLAKRELFSSMAMQGFCCMGGNKLEIIKCSVEMADLLIEELNK